MCTAITLTTDNHYFGRNLDLTCSYVEEVCVMPRRYPLVFRKMGSLKEHYAIIGMATVVDGIPLFYDGVNEFGLSVAGLNFPDNAYYPPFCDGKYNVTPFEFIPYILAGFKTVDEAIPLLENINLVNIPFSEQLPLSPLHWIISDRKKSVVVEAMKDGVHIHENPVGVLANNPPFNYHLYNLNNYRSLNIENGENTLSPDVELQNYSEGLGLTALPGSVSSASRFVRAAFARANSVCKTDEASAVGQFFHLLSFVEVPRGICKTRSGDWNITLYSSCINTDKGIYYYTTYSNRQITAINMHKTDLDGSAISRFPLLLEQKINYVN